MFFLSIFSRQKGQFLLVFMQPSKQSRQYVCPQKSRVGSWNTSMQIEHFRHWEMELGFLNLRSDLSKSGLGGDTF